MESEGCVTTVNAAERYNDVTQPLCQWTGLQDRGRTQAHEGFF